MSMPPLAAIRVFEAVARHLSFTRAAEELAMTQAGVSYQIRILEEAALAARCSCAGRAASSRPIWAHSLPRRPRRPSTCCATRLIRSRCGKAC
ncbi:LysR family transcriptional regulator [Paracoccus sp. DMF-8]|uniref:LysR family transcriptional regulator n=1 Tax=Paracoccus sp. DMF-8 TaxID=3019445 RepID=UPI0023E80E11|nr:LysR family transcriptional regulator [Paracoccus sp. DMF-8]MDF3605745.1 LysR family transcriptional regulator [Paracoccus sp. DMF-8]